MVLTRDAEGSYNTTQSAKKNDEKLSTDKIDKRYNKARQYEYQLGRTPLDIVKGHRRMQSGGGTARGS